MAIIYIYYHILELVETIALSCPSPFLEWMKERNKVRFNQNLPCSRYLAAVVIDVEVFNCLDFASQAKSMATVLLHTC